MLSVVDGGSRRRHHLSSAPGSGLSVARGMEFRRAAPATCRTRNMESAHHLPCSMEPSASLPPEGSPRFSQTLLVPGRPPPHEHVPSRLLRVTEIERTRRRDGSFAGKAPALPRGGQARDPPHEPYRERRAIAPPERSPQILRSLREYTCLLQRAVRRCASTPGELTLVVPSGVSARSAGGSRAQWLRTPAS